MKKDTLKNWFSDGKKPTGQQFSALIDSFVHKDEISSEAINNITQFTKDVNSELNDIKEQLEVNGASIDVKANSDSSNLTPPQIESWRNTLGVGELPSNIATVDEDNKVGNAYTKEQITELLESGNTNIATSHLTTTADGGVTQGADYVWNLGGRTFSFLNRERNLPRPDNTTRFTIGNGDIRLHDYSLNSAGTSQDGMITVDRLRYEAALKFNVGGALRTKVASASHGVLLYGIPKVNSWDNYTYRLAVGELENTPVVRVRTPRRWYNRLSREITNETIPLNRPGTFNDFYLGVPKLFTNELYKVRICIIGDTRLVNRAIKHNDRVGYLGYPNKLIRASEAFYSIIQSDTTNVGNIEDNRDIFTLEFIIKAPNSNFSIYPCFSRQDGVEGYGSIMPGSFIEVEEIIT